MGEVNDDWKEASNIYGKGAEEAGLHLKHFSSMVGASADSVKAFLENSKNDNIAFENRENYENILTDDSGIVKSLKLNNEVLEDTSMGTLANL
jgi:hypothetical protein